MLPRTDPDPDAGEAGEGEVSVVDGLPHTGKEQAKRPQRK